MPHFMERFVNKALEKSQAERLVKFKLKTPWRPDIAISRDPGSGGRVIAQKLANRLEWQLFDKEFIRKLSKDLDIPEREVANIDEHNRSWITDLFHSVFNPDYVSDIRYITQLKRLLNHASKTRDLVVLGRGANLILPPDKCLRVRITACLKTRVKNTYQFEHYPSLDAAADRVRHIQNQRNSFIRQYFGVNPHNPWNYDLVISTDNFTLDQAVEIIIKAYHLKFPKKK